jgi:hypothetical protein
MLRHWIVRAIVITSIIMRDINSHAVDRPLIKSTSTSSIFDCCIRTYRGADILQSAEFIYIKLCVSGNTMEIDTHSEPNFYNTEIQAAGKCNLPWSRAGTSIIISCSWAGKYEDSNGASSIIYILEIVKKDILVLMLASVHFRPDKHFDTTTNDFIWTDGPCVNGKSDDIGSSCETLWGNLYDHRGDYAELWLCKISKLDICLRSELFDSFFCIYLAEAEICDSDGFNLVFVKIDREGEHYLNKPLYNNI